MGIKLVDRSVIADVLPLLRESRFALDLELLVVARRLGYTRIVEAPVRIEERFTSTISVRAVLSLLVDTLAVFWRLSVVRAYDPGIAALRSGQSGGGDAGAGTGTGGTGPGGPEVGGPRGRGPPGRADFGRLSEPAGPAVHSFVTRRTGEGICVTRPDRHPQRRPGGAPRCRQDHAGRSAPGGDRVPPPPGVGGEGHHGDGLRARGDGPPDVHLDQPGLLRGERGQGQPAGHAGVRRLRGRDADRTGQRRPGRRRGERHRRRAGPDRGRLAGGGPPRAAPGRS